jgi:type IV pilus assembly protein PilC
MNVSFGSARLSIKEQTLFAKRMSFMVKAGVPIIESLTLIRTQTKSPKKAKVFDSIIHDVNNGQYLSTALAKFERMFGEFAINLIRVGEESGILSQNLAYLADELHKKDALRRKVLGAMIYPAVITLATLGITGILTVFIFPKITPIFSSMHITLPLSTRLLMAISDFLRAHGILTIIALILLAILLVVVKRRVVAVQYFLDRWLLKLPFAGKMATSYNLANFCRTLGLLLQSGIQLTDATTMVARTTPNLAYREAYERLGKSIVKGEPISRALLANPALFPDILAHMVSVGETTGNLSNTFTYLSELYEAEVEEQTKNLSQAIEPILMVIMGVLVGFIAVSIITPIYAITQNLQT